MRLRSVCLRTLGSHGKERKPWSSRDSCACAHPASGACCVDHTAPQHVPKMCQCVVAGRSEGARKRGSEEGKRPDDGRKRERCVVAVSVGSYQCHR